MEAIRGRSGPGCAGTSSRLRRARGIGDLLARNLTAAEEDLAFVWEHLERNGVEEPGVFPVAPDLVEALADLGKLDEAQLAHFRPCAPTR